MSTNTPADITVIESDSDDLATQRYLLDLALQPLDSFVGFTRLEQIGGSALRYQLNYACYALALAQYTRTPAFTGYLAEAQANLIRKMCDKRVWGYWAAERLAGYGRWNPDPMVFGNIMYTGFFASMLALYQTMNDDRSFDPAGSLPLVWSRRTRYDYGYSTIAEAIRRNMRHSRQTLYPCEPHLIYPMCNTIAITGLHGYDRLHGTDLTGDLVTRIEESFHRNRYLRPNGRFVFGRGPAGFVIPPMVSNDAVMSYWLNGLMPELAEQTWTALRDSRLTVRNGRAELRAPLRDNLDAGSYRFNGAWTWVNVACAAGEMDDPELAVAVQATIADRYGFEYSASGARKLVGASSWANCAFALSVFLARNALRGLATGQVPAHWRTGPLLAAAPYPDLLVARAVTDGRALDVVLRPGGAPVTTRVRVARLDPGARYRVIGGDQAEIVADAAGTALIGVRVADRHEFRVEPIPV